MRTRGGRARAFCCVTSRRPASPPLARTHARSFSVLAPLFLHFPLLPDRRSRSLRAVHSGDPGRARRHRRLREARRGRDREENAGVATGVESIAQQLPPERPAHPFARPPCPVHDVSATPRRRKVAPEGGRGRAGGCREAPPPPNPPLSTPSAFSLLWRQSFFLVVGGPVSLFRLPLAGGGHFSSRCPLSPPRNGSSPSPRRKSHFSSFASPGYSNSVT